MGLAAGQIALDTDLSALVSKTYQKPIGRALASATQVIPTTTQTAFLFGNEDYDTHGQHSTSVSSGRITPLVPGYYRFIGTAFWGVAVAGNDQVLWRKNGTTNLPPAWKQQSDTNSSTSMGPNIVTIPMNGTTDYVEFTAIMGAGMTTALSVQFATVIEWEFVRDL